MRLRTEEGLDFWCTPVDTAKMNIEVGGQKYLVTIKLDDDIYIVGLWDQPNICKGKARSFVGKFKIPVKVILAERLTETDYKYTRLYDYKYEFYLKWQERKSQLSE